MIKRSKNHEKYCNGSKPHLILKPKGLGIDLADNNWRPKRVRDELYLWKAIRRMDFIWAVDLSKRIAK